MILQNHPLDSPKTQNYNRIFLALTKNLRKEGFRAARLKKLLLAQTGESGVWPDDATFRDAWLHTPLYVTLSSLKLQHLYARLNQTYMSRKSEIIAFSEQLTVEHIMPQNWQENWRLQDDSKGMDARELFNASESVPRALATRQREAALQTLGNLTILSTGLNAAQSNYGWNKKRPEMMKHSLLPINQSLLKMKRWDETAILKRGAETSRRALDIWGG
jgi:hypothetical protein